MRRWVHTVTALGGLLVGGSLAAGVLIAVETRTIRGALIPLVPTAILGGVLLYGERWLSRSELRSDTYPRVVAWCFGGAGILLLNVALLVINPTTDINTPVQSGGLATGIGAVAGFTIGVNEARAISHGREAERRRDALGFLSSTLRHEALNSINVIRGTTTELAKKSDEETGRQLDVVTERCDSLVELIRNIGPVARTLTGQAELIAVDLSACASEQVETIESTFPDARITAEIEPGVTVRANEGLSHAVSNVLINAIDHNDTETPRVEVTVRTAGDVARLRIADNGPGIDDSKKERIFESDTDRDRGFGLYMVHTLLSSFDGDIRVEDNDPRGSVFTIELPRADVD